MADDAPTQDLSEETQPSEDQPEQLSEALADAPEGEERVGDPFAVDADARR